MTNIIAFSLFACFLVAVSIAYMKDVTQINHFRKNLHRGTVVKYHKGRSVLTSIVQAIPGKESVVIKSLDNDKFFHASIHDIFPL